MRSKSIHVIFVHQGNTKQVNFEIFSCFTLILTKWLSETSVVDSHIYDDLLGDCPNITCFRCGDFGHHSKSCHSTRRSSRAVICTLCASSTHDSRHCLQPPEKALARLEDKSIRCMKCNQLGHALCGATVEKKIKKHKYVGEKNEFVFFVLQHIQYEVY